MAKDKKSYDLEISIGDDLTKEEMMSVVERAAEAAGLYISHIGGYSRVKYPNSVHWHFKRHKKEPGLIDATFWEEGAKFWLVVRNNEPEWVHETAPLLQKALENELVGLYTLPTAEGLLPFPQSQRKRDPSRLSNLIVEQVNKACAASASQSLENASECLRGDWNTVACLPMLDPTTGRDHGEYSSPFENFGYSTVPQRKPQKAYAYVHSASKVDLAVLEALADFGLDVDLFCDDNISGIDSRVTRLSNLPGSTEIPKSYSLVYHQAGLGISMTCLLHAIPQILNPKHFEARMTASRLLEARAGIRIHDWHLADAGKLREALNDFQTTAQSVMRADLAESLRQWSVQNDWRKQIGDFFANV